MEVYCKIYEEYQGVRELQSFNNIVNRNWSMHGKIFPMYDLETMEIFECGFNADTGWIVAFNAISAKEFRRKIESISEKLLKDAIAEAVKTATDDMSALYAELQMIEVLRAMTNNKG